MSGGSFPTRCGALALLAALALPAQACDREDERDVERSLEEAAEEVDEAVREARPKVEEGLEDAGRAVGRGVEAAGEALQRGGEAIQEEARDPDDTTLPDTVERDTMILE